MAARARGVEFLALHELTDDDRAYSDALGYRYASGMATQTGSLPKQLPSAHAVQ